VHVRTVGRHNLNGLDRHVYECLRLSIACLSFLTRTWSASRQLPSLSVPRLPNEPKKPKPSVVQKRHPLTPRAFRQATSLAAQQNSTASAARAGAPQQQTGYGGYGQAPTAAPAPAQGPSGAQGGYGQQVAAVGGYGGGAGGHRLIEEAAASRTAPWRLSQIPAWTPLAATVSVLGQGSQCTSQDKARQGV